MRIAIISDIHANLPALEAVLHDIERQRVDKIYCLGDTVGYGGKPVECVERVRAVCAGSVIGNHDEAVALNEGTEFLPRDGQVAAALHRSLLSEDDISWLAERPKILVADGVTFVHAAPQEPQTWLRIESLQEAQAQFQHFETDFCMIGHTHVAGVIGNKIGVLRVRPGYRYLINPGAVGQPRDGNPRASYGVLDTEAVTYQNHRIPYNIERAMEDIRSAGLPKSLAYRLAFGN